MPFTPPDRLIIPAQPGGGVVGNVPFGQIRPTQFFSIIGATNATPIVITTKIPHPFVTGNMVNVSGVLGNTAANGNWAVTVLDSTHFSLNTSVGNGVFQPGKGWCLLAANLTPPVGSRMTVNRRPDASCTVLFNDQDNSQLGPIAELPAGTFLVPGGIPQVDGEDVEDISFKITNTSAFVSQYLIAFDGS